MFNVETVPLARIRAFVETHHYSHSVNGVKISDCFALMDGDRLVGAAVFGQLSTTAWKRYAKTEAEVVELRRLVCLDECPRNTESWFMARCLKHLKRHSPYRICVSYADPEHGHVGLIYQAANWSYHGQTAADTVLVTPFGRRYHSRAMRTKHNGRLKPFAATLQCAYKLGALATLAVPGKYIYTYTLKGTHQRENIRPYPKPDFSDLA